MRVVREVTLDASLDEVWELLTDDAELSAWFGGDVSLDPTPGGTGLFVDDADVRRAVVDEVIEGRRLGFRWWRDDEGESQASSVQFELQQDGEATRLTVVEVAPMTSALSGGRPCARASAEAAWDDRLFRLEVRCLTRAHALVPVGR